MHRKGKTGGCLVVLLHTTVGERGSGEGVLRVRGQVLSAAAKMHSAC